MSLLGRLLLAFTFVFAVTEDLYAQCGEPPPLQNSTLKAELDGKANFVSKYFGEAGLQGKIESSKTEVLSKYPNADKTLANQYYLYVVCGLIFKDTSLTTLQKLQEFQKARDSLSPPRQSKLTIQSNGPFIDDMEIGGVRANSSSIRFEINGEYVGDFTLSSPFDGISEVLPNGEHLFTYRADVRAISGLRIRSACSVKINLQKDAFYSPRIVFAPYDDLRGIIKRCDLLPL